MRNGFARFLFLAAASIALLAGAPGLPADNGGAPGGDSSQSGRPASTTDTGQEAAANAQAAAVATLRLEPEMPDFVTHLGDRLLELFGIRTTGNSWERYTLAAGILALFYLFRRLILPLMFKLLHRGTKRVSPGLMDKVLAAVELPIALFIMITGTYAALRILYHVPEFGKVIHQGARILWSAAFLWTVIRIAGGFLDHVQANAGKKNASVAAFMPWIRKSVVGIFVIFGGLVILQQFGVNIQTFLAGLGIGGLAFALAAQDTVANVFGAAVVAVDQPFKIGEMVTLAGHTGVVEDIGIRSMKLRRSDKALVVIPNKTVASESIINLSRFTNRRVDQVLGFTYDSTPDQMEGIVTDLRTLISADADVLPGSAQVYFRDFNASSLDLVIVYVTKEPGYDKHMILRQRLNLAFMRAAQARGLSFAFPTQTLDLGPTAVKVFGKSQGVSASPQSPRNPNST